MSEGTFMVTQGTTIDTLAAHYGKRVITSSGRRGFRMGCPVHQGTDPNCSVFESDGGRIGANCWSTGCEPSAIMVAMERDCNLSTINPPEYTFQATYRRNGKPVDVWRIDRPDGSKDFPTAGSREGIPLLIHGDAASDLIIVVEGERAARAVQRAGFTAASYLGGAKSVKFADYSILKDKTVAIWPDNDVTGFEAGELAARKAQEAGADPVWFLAPVEGDKADAANVPPADLPAMIDERLATATPFEDGPGPEVAKPFRLVWRDMADVADLPEINWILPGVLAAPSVALLTGATKAGKTLFTLALLKAATTGQPFLGYTIPMMRAWYLTEMTDYVLKAQLGIIDWTPPRNIFPVAYKNEQDFFQMSPQALADALLWDYESAVDAGIPPKLVCFDTLGRWLRGFDFNDYSQVNAATEPLLRVASELKDDGCIVLLLHHQRKGGGRGTDGSLGSQALSGAVDTHCGLTIKSADSEIRALNIQSRLGIGELGSYAEIELILPAGEYRVISSDPEDVESMVLEFMQEQPEGATPKGIREALDLDQNQQSRACTALVKTLALTTTGKTNKTRYHLAEQAPKLT